MALSREKKQEVIQEVSELLANSKMTVIAAYKGTPVKAMQNLRKAGRDRQTTVRVVKNRLMKKAVEKDEGLSKIDTGVLQGMLLYAFNSEDEVAPAQTLAEFAKKQPTIEFVGAFSGEGRFLSADEVKDLSTLPSKEELIAQVISTLNSPLNDTVSSLSGNLHGLLDGIEAKAQS